ncbi:MAG: hypothetical protein QOF48_2583 [Verrucomicrobiota bacterium]|jgi:hypothetical protein
MKKIAVIVALGALTMATQAANLNVVDVNSPGINCLFNTNCTNTASERISAFTINGTTGTGYVHSRVITGETGALAARHYGYEYQIDLGGIVADPNNPISLTNVVKCETNRVEIRTNQVVCPTNIVVCTTNRIAATNAMVCFTNVVAGTNVQQCITNAATGAVVCFTNRFPSITNVFCTTNRIPARTVVTCQTNPVPVGANIACATNRVTYRTNVATCRTNITTTPGSPACIKSFRLHIGPIVSRLDLNNDGTNTDNVYVVRTGGQGSAGPSKVEWDDNDLVVSFSPPLCAGDSSFTVGFVARTGPTTTKAKLKATSGSDLSVKVIGPGEAIRCNFDDLAKAIRNLRSRELTGSSSSTREDHRTTLLAMLAAASDAAQAGNIDNLTQALGDLISKADGRGQDWLTGDGRDRIKDEVRSLLHCIQSSQDGDDDDDENDDDDDDHDGNHHD